MLVGGADVDVIGLGDGDDLLWTGVDTWLIRGDSWVLTWNHVGLGDGSGDWCNRICTWSWADIGGQHNLGGDGRVLSLSDGDWAGNGGLGINNGSNTTDSVSSVRQSSSLLTAKVLGAGQGQGLLRDSVNPWSRAGGDLWRRDLSVGNLNHGCGRVPNLNSGGCLNRGHIVGLLDNGYVLLVSYSYTQISFFFFFLENLRGLEW